ncbi:MAG TPA: hypothetical protein VD926_13285 [Acidimicrobiales bacterium]|nr:hypothetical protein [Acidimicrobiales bacterium]
MTAAVVALVGASVVFGATAGATHSHNDGGPHEFVVGHLKRGVFSGSTLVDGSVSAHRQSDGSAQGHFEIRNTAGVHYGGEVNCLNVVGDNATIEIQVTHHTTDALEGTFQRVVFSDRGNPGGPNRGDSPDFFSPGPFTPTAQGCRGVAPISGPGLQGNITVHDATP